MLKYCSKWEHHTLIDFVVRIGQQYLQHEVQHYFIFNDAYSKLVSEEYILKNFKEIK